MLLSIIVPVYNVQNYLKKCIVSLFQQDLEPSNYEVITVNDGSTDDSLDVLQALQITYPTLKIISQDNQGLSGARNTGINNACGNYILFVDADDYILENTLNKLTSIALLNKLDIIEFAATGVTEHGKTVYKAENSTKEMVLTGEQYITNIPYIGSACNKLYNKDFLNKHNFRFMPKVYIEDIEFNTRVIFKASRVLAADFMVAHFLQRDGSITRSKNLGKTKKMIYDIHKVLTSINTFNELEVTPNSSAYIPIKKRTSALVITMLLRVLTGISTYEIKKDIFKQLKKQKLYPISYKTDSKSKNMFRLFANQNILFSIICKIYCLKNSQQDAT